MLCLLTVICLSSCKGFESVGPEEFAALIADGKAQLIDVRRSDEFAEEHIPGALNLNSESWTFMEEAEVTLDPALPVALYCRSGRRSAETAEKLAKKGYKIVDLKGGVLAWGAAGLPLVDSRGSEVDLFITPSGKPVVFHALVHASMLIQYDGLNIYVDPVTKMGGRVFNYIGMPRPQYVFVTHEHGDHFDREALSSMTAAEIVTNARCAEMLGRGTVMANGDTRDLGDIIKVEAVPAYNKTEGRTHLHPKGRDNGFILTIDGLRIYVAGDTEDVDEMADIHDIDVAFMPCNQPYTMTPEQLVNAVKIVKPKVVFPYHYGNTDLSGIPADIDGTEVRIRQYQ